MGVAPGAGHREPQPDRARGFDAVEGVLGLVFLDDGAAFARAHVATDIARRNFLVKLCFWQQIASQLLDRELIVGHVFVEGINHPIAPLPQAPVRIDVVAVRVGVPGGIKPIMRHLFAIIR